MKNLNEYRDAVNAWAERKGWNEKPQHVGDELMLFVTEIAEAKEDLDRGRMLRYLDETGKPCGFPSELADLLIRMFHASGRLKLDLDHDIAVVLGTTPSATTLWYYAGEAFHYGMNKAWTNANHPDDALLQIILALARAKEYDRRGEMEMAFTPDGTATGYPVAFCEAILRTLYFARLLNINLEEEVQVKMAYNETREKRHGGLRS